MLICKGDKSYKCSDVKTSTLIDIETMQFSILEPISQNDAVDLFDDETYYFYDDVLNGRMVDTNNKKIVGLRIKYNADSTCDITIKSIKGVVDNES